MAADEAAIGDTAPDTESIPGDTLAQSVEGGVATLDKLPDDGTRTVESYWYWWHAYIGHSYWTTSNWSALGRYNVSTDDTDIPVSAGTPIILRHASRLVGYGTYAWGYQPTFLDTYTGYHFRFLHLNPSYERSTWVGHTYPAGYVVGYSGGNTYATGYPTYSSGAHLCVQTLASFRKAFPW